MAAAKKALDPPDLVATQMPRLQQGADDEWGDQADSLSRGNSGDSLQAMENDNGPGGLPGFAKASELQRKRTAESLEEGDPECFSKKPLFEAEESDNANDDGDDTMQEDETFLQPHPPSSPRAESALQAAANPSQPRIWVPGRRPNGNVQPNIAEERESARKGVDQRTEDYGAPEEEDGQEAVERVPVLSSPSGQAVAPREASVSVSPAPGPPILQDRTPLDPPSSSPPLPELPRIMSHRQAAEPIQRVMDEDDDIEIVKAPVLKPSKPARIAPPGLPQGELRCF